MMAAAPMESQPAERPSTDASSAVYPRWVMLRPDLKIEVVEGSTCSTTGATAKTLAAARTSTGHLIQISLSDLTEPPEICRVCLQIPDGLDTANSGVVAAHGDSVLIHVVLLDVSTEEDDESDYTDDHFVYCAGDAAADPPRPPSLCLLPPFSSGHPTGLVRCGDDVVVVGQVERVSVGPDTPELMREADLSVFRSGEWSIKRVQIRFRDVSEVQKKLPSYWHAMVPIGDGLLSWVNFEWRCVLLCDVFEETPRMQYIPLPMENILGPRSNRNVCATAGGNALKFVNIFPRCCCAGAGATSCERSRHAYTIQTWTMRIGNDDMEWVKDAMVDAFELWAHDSYKGLKYFPLDHPLVSWNDPEVIFFWLHEPPEEDSYWSYRDTTVDVLMVNTRSKTIQSVSRCDDGLLFLSSMQNSLIPSNVSYFFNPCQSSGSEMVKKKSSGSDATSTEKRQEDIERPPPVIVDDQLIIRDNDASNPTMLCIDQPSVQESEIFEVFQAIPSYVLDHDEVKVYRILRQDNCRRFRSLLRIPKNLRKDWLLMEIKKATED